MPIPKEEALRRAFLSGWPSSLRGEDLEEDCGALPPGEAVLSTDTFTEGADWRPGWLSPGELGRRCLAGALSDLAAAGAGPVGLWVSLTLSAGEDEDFARELGRGMGEAAAEWGCVLRGGDTGRGPAAITLTVAGRPGPRVPGRRGGAPGDVLFTTGAVGAPRAALLSLLAGGDGGDCRDAWVRPRPHLEEGRLLASRPEVSALMDLSDGLAADLERLCRASGVGAVVEEVPVDGRAERRFRALGRDPRVEAARGGEEFCLLGACRPRGWRGIAAALPGVRRLGRLVSGRGIRWPRGCAPRPFDPFDP